MRLYRGRIRPHLDVRAKREKVLEGPVKQRVANYRNPRRILHVKSGADRAKEKGEWASCDFKYMPEKDVKPEKRTSWQAQRKGATIRYEEFWNWPRRHTKYWDIS